MSFPHLFSPISIGNIELPNRIVHVPTDISSSHADGEVSERDIAHHSEIARGGTGFVIDGATTPDAKTGRPTVTCLVADGDNYIPGLARLAESMHRYGARCAVQLQHPGRQCAIPRYNTLGATDRVLKLPWSAGHEIVYENAEEKGKEIRAASIAEILELVDLFSEAAWRVKQAGFDAVELHAAHGYLLSEFMSPYLNMRTDRFGGSFENRMRFPLAVIDSIKNKCGKSFPVLVRYSFEEWCEGGRDMAEGLETARVLERAGVAAIDISNRPVPASTRCITRRVGRHMPRRRPGRSFASRSSRATHCVIPSTASRSWPRARPTWWACRASCWPTPTGRSRPSTGECARFAAASRAWAAAGRNR
jgi:2,4-dienoyl-CoA reductase-like NADH-dependent reductase (Old Yellow Enzyme family)